MAERIDFFDVLRGVAIIGVVAIHASGTGLQFKDETLDYYLTIFWRNFWNFSVPLFLTISGYFLAKKSFFGVRDYLGFLSKQIPKVYWPLLFWSIISFLIAVANKISFSSELLKLVTFQSSGPYYFIALIAQYYLLLPILKPLANLKGLVACGVASFTATFVIFYIRYCKGIDLPLILYAGNIFTWLLFFVFGLYVGVGNRIALSNKLLLNLTVCFYLLSCLETWLIIDFFNKPKEAVTAIKISSFMYAFTLIAYLFKNKDIIIIDSKVLKKLGTLSFGIYLIHMFAMSFESRALHKLLPGLQENSILFQLLLASLVVLTCALCIAFVNKMISNRLSLFIGFK
jgi:surface polysaccharide O-acyltransferase-like enzyme